MNGISAELEQRLADMQAEIEALRQAPASDSTAELTNIAIHEEGLVVNEPAITEGPVIEEVEEGDLLVVEEGVVKRLKPGPKGDFLSSTGKALKWVPAPGGGGVVPAEFAGAALLTNAKLELEWNYPVELWKVPVEVEVQIEPSSILFHGEINYIEWAPEIGERELEPVGVIPQVAALPGEAGLLVVGGSTFKEFLIAEGVASVKQPKGTKINVQLELLTRS